jgi:hypothetical protein
MDETVAGMEKAGGGADPILCTQSTPDRLTFGKAAVSGQQATVMVQTHWGAGVQELTVSLVQGVSGWQIDKIACPAQ